MQFLSFFAIFEFDIFSFFKVPCLVQFDAYDALYGVSSFLLVMMLVVVIGLMFILFSDSKREHALLKRVIGWTLTAAYFAYPFGCKSIFSGM